MHLTSTIIDNALLDFGSNVRDEQGAAYMTQLTAELHACVAGEPISADTREWVDAARRGSFGDVNLEGDADGNVAFFQLDLEPEDDGAALLAEAKAITFDTDADAAQFILDHVWPWE